MLGTNGADGLPGFAGSIRTPFATLLEPGANVAAYVRAAGEQTYDPPHIRKNLVQTLDAGLARVRSDSTNMSNGYGDVVVVLPGHTENISSADQMSSLSPGTNIVCLGYGTSRPTFTWSAATATFLFDQPNTRLFNAVLEFAGDPASTTALTVAAPITVSAAGCGIHGCTIRMSVDADQLCTIGITTTAAADDFSFTNNHCFGATAGEVTTFMQIVGADRLHMANNYIQGATSAVGVGIVRFATTVSLDIILEDNYYGNLKALSTAAVTGLAGVSGVSRNEHFHYLDTASLTAWLTSTGLMSFHRPTVTNTAGETGTETVGTVSA